MSGFFGTKNCGNGKPSGVYSAAAVLVLVPVITACSQQAPSRVDSSDGLPTPSVSASASDQVALLNTYFSGLSAGGPKGYQRASAVAAQGSPAAVFASHQRNLARAAQEAGTPWSASAAVFNARDVQWESSGQGISDYAEFTDFEFDSQGRLVTWQVDGTDLRDLLASIDHRRRAGDLEITLQTCYQTRSQGLQCTYAAAGPTDQGVEPQGYLRDGRARALSVTGQPSYLETAPDRKSRGWFVVPSLGGASSDWAGTVQFRAGYDQTISIPTTTNLEKERETEA